MTRLLVLGFVFNLDLSNVPRSEEVEVKPRRYKPLSNVRQFKRHTYGQVQSGVIAFDASGAVLQDWFEGYEGRVGDAPNNFNPNGANDGNPAVKWSQSGGFVSLELADGFTAEIGIRGSEVWIEAASHDYSGKEAAYLLNTARLLAAPE
jgi:hypothetical protein